jgi:prepilin-type N-terminal cleavage/methylation domain-containing protein
MKKAFTLIELVIVIAILGIITTLAIQKLSGLKEDSQKKVNLANLKRIGAAIETYYAANAMENERASTIFNRLDSLTVWDAPDGAPGDTSKLGIVRDSLLVYTNQTENLGLSSSLASTAAANQYSQGGVGTVLGTFYLSAADAQALTDFGLKYVMRGYPENSAAPGGAYASYGDDGVYAQGSANNPDTCSCLARTNYAGMAVAAVNPGATVGREPAGCDIYRSCGQDVAYSGKTFRVMVGGVDQADNQAAFETLLYGSGVLLAFGIGDRCEMVGGSLAGLDSAPVSPTMKKDEYRRYIALLRLRRSGDASSHTSSVEFAGVMDPEGKTLSMLRAELR